jgi:hydroxyethylthiazole kinase-like uncharacterized protein yjeF
MCGASAVRAISARLRAMTALPPLYRPDEMRALEAQAFAQSPEPPLMVRAGEAAADAARELLGETGRSVLVLAGPGNNGGDAFEVAVRLKQGFYRVDVVFAGDDPAKLPRDAAQAYAKWCAVDGRLLQSIPVGARYDLVVDGLFGIGLARAIEGRTAALIDAANALPGIKLALDIASGIHGGTGAALGPAFRATHTVTFIAGKPGLYTGDGLDCCGEVRVAPLHLEAERLHEPRGRLATAAVLGALPLARSRNFHKGLAGSVAVIGGAPGMVGAAVLAGRAALKLGAGKVFLGLLGDDAPPLDWLQPELMMRRPDALLADVPLDAVAAGPGMGTDPAAQRQLAQALRGDAPCVLDADALNLIAQYAVLQSALQSRKAATILTPHPAEAARLLGVKTADVQADRVGAALRLAARFKCLAVVKGAGSVTAAPDGRWWINASGNPGMASAGMGDALTGMIAALLAQGIAADDAAVAGVHLHGAAGDALAGEGRGPLGITAGEVADAARGVLNRSLRR